MLDQCPVSGPTPVSLLVAPYPRIPDAETIELAPTTPNAEFILLATSTSNAETGLPRLQTLAHVLDQDITTSPGPPVSQAPDTHDAPTAGGQNTQMPSKGCQRSTRIAGN